MIEDNFIYKKQNDNLFADWLACKHNKGFRDKK